MNAKDLVKLNNEKRKALTKVNQGYYEEMLVYIRLNMNRSEQETEEVLMELLEHLLEAQNEGRTAREVFGDNPKEYCEEIIQEIPQEKKSETIQFMSYIICYFLAIGAFSYGILGFILNYFFNLGSNQFAFSLGSGIVIVLIYLLLLYIYIKVVFIWAKRSSFKAEKTKEWVEFLQLWFISTALIGLFVIVPFLMPAFGATIKVPNVAFIGGGAIFYIVAFTLNKKYRLTK